VVGTPSPRTGAQTPPSCSVLLLESQLWRGASARRGSTGTRCPRYVCRALGRAREGSLRRSLKLTRHNSSLTGSHLRDTGRDKSGSTRLHRRRPPVARAPLRKMQSCKDSMWEYGVYGLQREERLWERQLYIPYAKKRIDKFHQCCLAGIC
jgi:hypothetical protein